MFLAKGTCTTTYKQQTESEIYQIFSLKEVGFTQRYIAKSLKCNQSTTSRELKRNRETQKYCPKQAQIKVLEHRHSAEKAVKVIPEITSSSRPKTFDKLFIL
nr:helix-turn-helix domain-containing protein [Xenorhabdus bovienii]